MLTPPCLCSLKEMLYKRRMERKLLAARGLLDVEKAPEEDAPAPPATKGGYDTIFL